MKLGQPHDFGPLIGFVRVRVTSTTGKWVADLSTTLSSAKLPVLGQLARVRGRHWVVTDEAPTTLPFDIQSSTVGEGQTLVTLSSVEDDGLVKSSGCYGS